MAGLISIVAVLALLFSSEPKDTLFVDHQGGISIALQPGSESSLKLPAVLGAKDKNRPLVVIDPGHGGGDPGALSVSGQREADVTLSLARAIQSEMAASPRLRVALTRNENRFLPLSTRFEIARRLGASLFISLHADAAPHNQAARGATVYTLSEVASDREAASLAARENGANRIGGADLSTDAGVNRILIDLAQREAMAAAANFARIVYRERSPSVPFQPDYHRFAAFVVLKAPDIPSVLFESGYLTNPEDEAFVTSADGQRKIAQGLRRAAETYFARKALSPSS